MMHPPHHHPHDVRESADGEAQDAAGERGPPDERRLGRQISTSAGAGCPVASAPGELPREHHPPLHGADEPGADAGVLAGIEAEGEGAEPAGRRPRRRGRRLGGGLLVREHPEGALVQHPAGEHHGRVEQRGAAHPAPDDRADGRGVERERGGGHGVERDERHMEARIRKPLLRIGGDGGVLGCGVEREVGVADGGWRPGQPPGFHGRGAHRKSVPRPGPGRAVNDGSFA